MRKNIIQLVSFLMCSMTLPVFGADEVIDVLDFFVNRVSDQTGTESRANPGGGSWTDTCIWKEGATCYPNYIIINMTKGNPPWSSETYYYDENYIYLINENFYVDGHIDTSKYTRTMRDIYTGKKGMRWMPRYITKHDNFPQTIAYFDVEPFVEEYWVDSTTGLPACGADTHNNSPILDPAPTDNHVVYLGIEWDYMHDARSGHSGEIVPVELIKKSGTWAWGMTTENYYYGRVLIDGQWRGIGLVRYEAIVGGDDPSYSLGTNNYIVDCPWVVYCTCCPD